MRFLTWKCKQSVDTGIQGCLKIQNNKAPTSQDAQQLSLIKPTDNQCNNERKEKHYAKGNRGIESMKNNPKQWHWLKIENVRGYGDWGKNAGYMKIHIRIWIWIWIKRTY